MPIIYINNDDIRLNSSSSDKVVVNGNLGIGTTSPAQKLDVAGGDIILSSNATYIRSKDASGNTPRMFGINPSNDTYIGPIDPYAGGAVFYGVSANISSQTFYTGASARLHINSAGNVGIGTTSPGAKLDVEGEARSTHFRDGTKGVGTTSTAAGWYKIASWTGGARGGSEIKLSTTGGDFAPVTWVIRCYKDWSGGATLKLEQYGPTTWFTKARVVYDSTATVYYLEIYQPGTTAISFYMYQTSLMGYDASITMTTGTLVAGTTGGTTRTELPFTVNGTSVEALTIGNSGNTGPYLPLAGGTIDGTLIIDTDTGAQPFYVTRSGGLDQALKIYVDDAAAIFESIQDETASGYGSFIFNMDAGVTQPFYDIRKNNSTILRVDGSGNVGIGTTSPTSLLHIAYDGGAPNGLYVKSSTNRSKLLVADNDSSAYVIAEGTKASYGTADSLSTSNLTIDTSGNVGIGTTAPSRELEVTGAGNVYVKILTNSNTDFPALELSNAFAGKETWTIANFDTDNSLSIYNTGGTKAVITSAGNVGIGTTSPSRRLTVMTSPQAAMTAGTASGHFFLTNTGGSSGLYGLYGGVTSDGDGWFQSARNDSATYYNLLLQANGGNVGIGTTAPAKKLSVLTTDTFAYDPAVNAAEISVTRANTSNTAAQVAGISLNATGWSGGTTGVVVLNAIQQQGNYSNADFAIQNRVGGSFVETFRITAYGDVGIANSSPGSLLHIGTYNVAGKYVDSSTLPTTPANHLITLAPPSTEGYYGGGIAWSEGTDVAASINAYDAGSGGALGLVFSTGNNTTLSERLRIDTSGSIQLNDYGSGTFTGTVAYNLAVDASGNVIETAGGVVDGSGTANYVAKWSDANTLTDSVIYDDGTNVGIGTTNPTSKLQVSGNIDATGVISQTFWTNDSIRKLNSGASLNFRTAAGPIEMVLDGSGNLGIGTTSPGATLHVVGTHYHFANTGAGTNLVRVDQYGTDSNYRLDYKQIVSSGLVKHSYSIVNGGTGYADNLVLDRGNVGIGTASPIAKLHISSSTNPAQGAVMSDSKLVISGADGNMDLLSTDDNSTVSNNIGFGRYNSSTGTLIHKFGITSWANTGSQGSNTGRRIAFNYGTSTNVWDNTELMSITSGGNVGIGTTDPSAGYGGTISNVKLALRNGTVGANNGTSVLLIGGDNNHYSSITAEHIGGGLTYLAFGTSSSATNPSEKMRITSAGNVGIGTTAPSMLLHVAGPGRFSSTTTTISGTTGLYLSIGSSVNNYNGILFQGVSAYDMYFGRAAGTGVDDLVINNGNNELVRFKSTGNVGIGTTSPGAKLDVQGITTWSQGIRAQGNSTDGVGLGLINDSGKNWFFISTGSGNGGGANNLGIYEQSGDYRMYLKSGGNVGIGTTNPAYKLDVNGETRLGKLITTWSNSPITPSAVMYSESGYNTVIGGNGQFSTSYLALMTTGNMIYSGGNVGIGTTSPARALHVVSTQWDNITGGGAIFENNNTVGSGITLKPTASVVTNGSNGWAIYAGGPGAAISDGNLGFWAHGTNEARLVIQRGGNVGIGTTSPTQKLSVNGAIESLTDGLSEGGQVILRAASGGTRRWNIDNFSTSSSLRIFHEDDSTQGGGSVAVLINSSGNVGIGTTAPDSKFHVEDTSPEVRITGTGGTSFPRILWEYPVSATQASRWALTSSASGNTFYLYNYTQSKKVFQVDGTASHITLNHDAAGTTQIGTSTTQTAYQLYVATNVGQTGAIEASGSVKITSGALGVNIAASATAGRIDASNDIVAYSTSDKRLKENIKPIENALDKVKSLTGVEFDWIEETKHVHGYEGHDVGVIAQEVQEVLPEAIRTNDSGYLSVRYEKLIGLLIESNKELAARIEILEQKLKQ